MSKEKPLEDIFAGWDTYSRPVDGTKFRHYKGGEYEIVATGFIEATEVPAVVYRSLEKGVVWVRTAKDFFEEVEYGGQKQQRFVQVKE